MAGTASGGVTRTIPQPPNNQTQQPPPPHIDRGQEHPVDEWEPREVDGVIIRGPDA